MKAYEFESANMGTVGVEVTGRYDGGSVDMSAWCDDERIYRDFYDIDDADEIMVWLAEQGVKFETADSALFNHNYIQSVMIDGEFSDAIEAAAYAEAHKDMIQYLPDEVLAACVNA